MNLVRRGSRIDFGMWPFISDMRPGNGRWGKIPQKATDPLSRA